MVSGPRWKSVTIVISAAATDAVKIAQSNPHLAVINGIGWEKLLAVNVTVL
jgi:hypothetical protein